MGLLDSGAAYLAAQHEKLARAIVYQRGASQITVNAVAGKWTFRVDTGYGISEHYESRDYIVTSGALVIDGVTVEPRAGDLIRETEGSTVKIYEVMAPAGEQVWRYNDPFGRVRRIHTKFVRSEAA